MRQKSVKRARDSTGNNSHCVSSKPSRSIGRVWSNVEFDKLQHLTWKWDIFIAQIYLKKIIILDKSEFQFTQSIDAQMSA